MLTVASEWLIARFGPKAGKIIGYVLLGLALLVFAYVMVQIHSCVTAGQQEAQIKVDKGQAGAARASAADTVNTMGQVEANTMASEDLGRRNAEEIGNAAGSHDVVNPGVRDAGLRALCRRASAAHDPKCRMLQPHP